MAVAARVSVTTAATALVASSNAGGRCVVRNRGAVSVDVGGAGVTSGAGFELSPGESASFQQAAGGEALYGIVATGTCRVDVLRLEL